MFYFKDNFLNVSGITNKKKKKNYLYNFFLNFLVSK